MSDETLHRRLERMEAAQIVERFPHDLARDLLDNGISAIDAEHARQAASEVMRLCGLMQPAPMRRRGRATMAQDARQTGSTDGPMNFAEHSSNDAGSEAGNLAA